jgi:hypothetical protein
MGPQPSARYSPKPVDGKSLTAVRISAGLIHVRHVRLKRPYRRFALLKTRDPGLSTHLSINLKKINSSTFVI